MSLVDQTIWRYLSTTSLAVGSTSQTSTAVFGKQTYAVQVAHVGAAGVGVFVNVGSTLVQANSTGAGALLPSNLTHKIKVNPGETLAALCVGSAAVTLYVTELSK